MKISKTEIKDLLIIEPKLFEDERGYFFESYSKAKFKEAGLDYDFIQDNQSKSIFGTIRGLHFQKDQFAQAKLVRVLEGSVIDVAVDLRPDSETYGKHVAIELSEENKKQFLIPRGFAHGFSVISETAVFSYKCDNVYNKDSEGGIKFDDEDLNIDWKIEPSKAIVSTKDMALPKLKDIR